MSIEIIHLASGSAGNSVLVTDGVSYLMFDAGLSYRKLSNHLYEAEVLFSQIKGIFITHEHGDHCKAVPDLAKYAYPLYMSEGTALALNIHPSYFEPVYHNQRQFVGSFQVVPFDVTHDASEPMGFLFKSMVTQETGVYITDTMQMPPIVSKDINYWIIECNYSEDILESGVYHEALKNRVRQSHMSFENLERYLKQVDTSGAKKVILIHLSSANADREQFVNGLQAVLGVPVFAP